MNTRRAFTLVDIAALCATGACLLCLAATVLGQQPEAPRTVTKQLKDATQVRGLHQALIVFAQNNSDAYPLPSKFDTNDNTVADRGSLKDTTANIYSMLVFMGMISTELLVSPVEKNSSITVYDQYEFDTPKKSVRPAMALWDPAFGVDFSEGHKGHASYAHLQPSAGRAPRWKSTSKSSAPVISMRGPEISGVVHNDDGSVTPTFANPKSNTFAMYDEDASWSGNVAGADNAVIFSKHTLAVGKSIMSDPKARQYTDAEGKSWPDLWNFDEPDDPSAANDFLGIFVRAGTKAAEFKAIWD